MPEGPIDDRPGEQPDHDTGRDDTHDDTHDDTGLDLARVIARGLSGKTGPARKRTRIPRRTDPEPPQLSGAHPDDRDPQTLESTLSRFVDEHGWGTELRVHGVFTRWESIVGAEVGAHVTPESYADGRLVCRADSTAWATQMTLLAADVVRRLNEVLGEATVLVLDVHGPHAPRWSRGRLRVKGRGPRDTYG